MKTFKQIFCRHIWEDKEEKFLRTGREHFSFMYYNEYAYYAVYRKCLKCDLDEVEEKRYLLI
jgi:hypothetical protein